MKPHNKLTSELLHHRTHWISILTTETPFPKLYTQIKHVKYESGLHCIRFIQLCLKAGHADEGEAAIQYYKLNFKTSASAGLNALFLAVCQWYDFFIYHSERVDNLESEFLETVTGNHAIETKYIGYYTLGFYHLARSEFDTAKMFFSKLEQVYAMTKLDDVEDITTLRENVDVLLNKRDINEIQAYYEANIGLLSKNTLQNRVALIRLCSRRGDYARVYELIKPFPRLLLPKYTHIMASIAAQKTVWFNRNKVFQDPDSAHLQVMEGLNSSNPEQIMEAPMLEYGKVNPRIIMVCRIGVAWAFGQMGNLEPAVEILERTEILPVDHDVILLRCFTILDMVVRHPDSLVLKFDLSLVKNELLFNYQFLAKEKLFDNNLVPGYSEVIWFLACISDEFEQYKNTRKTVIIFEKGVLIDSIVYTTPIYKAIFRRKTQDFTQESLKKARHRIGPKIESDKPLIIIDFQLLVGAAPKFIQLFPEAAPKIRSKLKELGECVNISVCLPEPKTSSSALMPDLWNPFSHEHPMQ